MNGLILSIPLILIRYGLLAVISRDALKRAAYFPPVRGREVIALWIYQISNIAMFIYLIFLTVDFSSNYFIAGTVIYILGTLIYVVSIVDYAKPGKNGINTKGLYRISRNPMYVAYFLYFLGCSVLTLSWLLLVILIIFQISVHWIILSEERWCIREYGSEYLRYMNNVRRYI